MIGCGKKEEAVDVTGKWQLDTLTLYGVTLKAENCLFNGSSLAEIGFEVKDEKAVKFVKFSELFDAAIEAALKEAGVTEEQVQNYLPELKAALEKNGIKEDDIKNFYELLDTQTYEVVQDKFNILIDGQTLLSGTIKDANTIYVPDFALEGFELTFVKQAK